MDLGPRSTLTGSIWQAERVTTGVRQGERLNVAEQAEYLKLLTETGSEEQGGGAACGTSLARSRE